MRILDNIIFRAEKFKDPKAAYQLGVIYHTGDRVEPNPQEARRWLERAVELGHEEAPELLARLEGRKTQPRVQKGKDRVRAQRVVEPEPPPVIEKSREQGVDFSQDLMTGQACPNGHGPLQDWDGQMRCWVCGWPGEGGEEELGQAEPAAHQPAGPLSKVAVASAVLGLLGLILEALLCLPALLLGYLAQYQLKQPGPRHQADEFLMKMGLATGWAGLVINLNYLIYFFVDLFR